jgi:Tol biopolymer transport system component
VSVSWLLTAAMTLLVFALGIGFIRRGTPDRPRILKASLLPPENASFGDIAVSPDGKWLAFTAATDSRVRLWLRSLASDEAKAVESTDGASHPFWSPDDFIGFFASGN